MLAHVLLLIMLVISVIMNGVSVLGFLGKIEFNGFFHEDVLGLVGGFCMRWSLVFLISGVLCIILELTEILSKNKSVKLINVLFYALMLVSGILSLM